MVEIREAKGEPCCRDGGPISKLMAISRVICLLWGWGGTFGYMESSVREMRAKGAKIGLAHFNYIKPLPGNTAEVFGRYRKIVVCELNLGQFCCLSA